MAGRASKSTMSFGTRSHSLYHVHQKHGPEIDPVFYYNFHSLLVSRKVQEIKPRFTLITHTSITIVLVHVDDILVAGNALPQIEFFKNLLSTHFKTKDLGSLKFFLGLEVAHSSAAAIGVWTTSFPMEHHLKLSNEDGSLLPDPSIYRCLVGRLIYLTITRPDIVYAVNILSQFMHAPHVPHMTAATRVLRYIKGSPGQGIFFSSSSTTQVTAYTDSDWAICPTTRRSTTGYFIQLGTSPISWRTKK
ncbi:uncharacterized mitochondrial protein AtMg00810-like [Juglans microcarpa x Juglans regia]|uniref:uncharacterized mitochondrial protein AtMg00810-like n=1 Tax=Juglans microcarpa x Juglans regia TaxID=2249226 RepID=UPI001B7EBB2E|nr:uncharacterized mitochondrial protein AtMg00810-like [Juglans microcarpa x Juglans regia]